MPEGAIVVETPGFWVEPGEDVELCDVVRLPGTPDQTYYVNGFEIAMHEWSHHVIINAIIPGSPTEANTEEGMRKPCTRNTEAWGEDMVDVTGAQQPYANVTFPEGIGRVYHGGQLIAFDQHYFNPTTERIPARHKLVMHQVAEEDVERVSDGFGFYNLFISTPPGETSRSAAQCTFKEDTILWSLTRHTHRWGTNFGVWFHGGDRDGEHLWTSRHWEDELNYVFDEPILMKAGTGFRYQCEYNNTEDHPLKFGLKATDEMCILFGIGWSPTTFRQESQSCFGKPAPVEDL